MPQFQPGQSGNPGGRPRGQGEARRIAREHAGHAVFALARLCCDLRATPGEQMRAAELLLRLGFGAAAKEGFPEGARGRWPGLRSRVRALLEELDADHARLRRVLLVELAELEREEGLTEARA